MNPAQSKAKFAQMMTLLYTMGTLGRMFGTSKPVALFSNRKWNMWNKKPMKRNKIPTRIKKRKISYLHVYAFLNQIIINKQFAIPRVR